jgi:hypothetical protein
MPSGATPWLLIGLAGVEIGMVARTAAGRIAFPWDLLLWAESPFLTNLWKLDQGQPIFSAAADANSFVYSPGLEYLCYALLKPFETHLDIRYCRAVSAGIGLLAALAGGLLADRVARALWPQPRRVWPPLLAASLLVLLIFHNFTSLSPHPDNSFTLHAVLTLWLCLRAIGSRRSGDALIAVGVASLGMWTKQTSLLAPVGATLAILAGARWDRRTSLAIAAAATAATLLSAAALFGPDHAFFQLVAVPASHPFDPGKLVTLFVNDLLLTPHRLVIWTLSTAAVIQLARSRHPAVLGFLRAWFLVGVFGVAPCLAGYLKQMGFGNNLYVADVWLLLPVLVVLGQPPRANPGGSLVTSRRVWMSGVAALLLALFPLKALSPEARFAGWASPVQGHISPREYGELLQDSVRRDIDAGRRVLVAHGTMVLLRSGQREIPLDRSNSVLELVVAGKADLAHTRQRLEGRFYDRVYVPRDSWIGPPWYGEAVQRALAANYHRVGRIPEAPAPAALTFGTELFREIAILEPRDGSGP